jgi:succinate dehydrogenase / fumarate reductase, cytochrome b subunit
MSGRPAWLLSVGLKFVVAITGLVMLAFVAFHLVNNVHLFFGQEIYNRDAFAWKHPLVIHKLRVVLLTAIALHIAATVWITVINRKARGTAYKKVVYARSTWTARLMIVSGFFVAFFVVYHVLHAKAGWIHTDLHEAVDPWGRKDVYNLIVVSLRDPFTNLVYLLGLTGLFSHLHHGIQSTLSSLGVRQQRGSTLIRNGGRLLALLLYLGYVAIPIAVAIGWIQPA